MHYGWTNCVNFHFKWKFLSCIVLLMIFCVKDMCMLAFLKSTMKWHMNLHQKTDWMNIILCQQLNKCETFSLSLKKLISLFILCRDPWVDNHWSTESIIKRNYSFKQIETLCFLWDHFKFNCIPFIFSTCFAYLQRWHALVVNTLVYFYLQTAQRLGWNQLWGVESMNMQD